MRVRVAQANALLEQSEIQWEIEPGVDRLYPLEPGTALQDGCEAEEMSLDEYVERQPGDVRSAGRLSAPRAVEIDFSVLIELQQAQSGVDRRESGPETFDR